MMPIIRSRHRPRRPAWRPAAGLALMSLVLLGLVGCAAAPPREAFPPFRHGVMLADQQTAVALAEVNSFLLAQQIDRALRQPALGEELFAGVLDAADVARWRRAFALIESYAEKLERLSDPTRRAGVEEELAGLGDELVAQHPDRLPPGLAAAFVQLGGLLAQLKAERDARAAIRLVDPALQDVFAAMQAAIGQDHESGVRGTVWTAWSQVLARIDVLEFRRAADDAARRTAVQRYVETLDRRQVHDLTLDALRRSLAALALAHRDLALDRRTSADAMIRLIQQELLLYDQRLTGLRDRHESMPAGGGDR
jgi:hypothetical protein